MGEFLQHLIRFTEPLVSGGLALLMACWIFYERDHVKFRKLVTALGADSLRWIYAVAAFVVATTLGVIFEQASALAVDYARDRGYHDWIVHEEYDEVAGRLNVKALCPGIKSWSERAELRDLYGALHLLPTNGKDGSRIDGLVTDRTYFANDLARTTTLIALLAALGHFGLRFRRSREERRWHGVLLSAALAGASFAAYTGGEEAYHRSVRHAVIATVISRPDLCVNPNISPPPQH